LTRVTGEPGAAPAGAAGSRGRGFGGRPGQETAVDRGFAVDPVHAVDAPK